MLKAVPGFPVDKGRTLMTLIAMAVFNTTENERTALTLATLKSLAWTVDWDKHRLIVVDNGSCDETQEMYKHVGEHIPYQLFKNETNRGTANAINRAWRERNPGEHCVKVDNDVVINQPHWVDWMTDVFQRAPDIGICGLKRKDLDERPWGEGWKKSKLYMLPQEKGERWLVVEQVGHVMGTCQAYSSALLDRIGYLYQGNWKYGFDDSLAAARAKVAGFKSVFLHGFEIDHIDPGGDDYTEWKHKVAGEAMAWFNHTRKQYLSGKKDPYYDGGFSE